MQTRRERDSRTVLSGLVLVALLAWCAFNWCSTVVHIFRYYNPLPVSDYWRVIEDLPLVNAGRLSWLWRQHNEHRIVFPEAVFVVDYLLCAGRQILPLLLSFVCYVATLALVGHRFWSDASAPRRVKVQTILLCGVIAGWPLCVYVLGTPFLLQWTLLQFAVVLALDSVARFTERSRLRWVAICIGAAIVATYSSANGLLLWPILLTIAAVLRAPRSYSIALAASAAVSVGLYFVGYQQPGVPPFADLEHPLYCLGFVVSYFSMPFGALRSPLFGLMFGIVSVSLWLTCFTLTFRRRTRTVTTFEVIAFGYFTFVLLTAALTSIGRVNLADNGFGNAKVTRYLTIPLLGWALLIAVLMALSSRGQWKAFSTRVILGTALLVVGFMQIRLGRWLRTNDDYVAFQQWATISLENDLSDAFFLSSIFPGQGFVQHFLPVLRDGHKSIFADPVRDFLGKDFHSLFPHVENRKERGDVIRVTPVRGGVSILGCATNLDRGGRDTVLFVDGSGKVVGFGRHLGAGIPRELRPVPAPGAQIWVGFINGRYGTRSFVPYLADTGSRLASPIAKEPRIPVYTGTDPAL